MKLLETIDLSALADARRVAHHIAQPLTGVATSLVTPEPDDGHTTLRLHPSGALVTQPFRDGEICGVDLAAMKAFHIGAEETAASIAGWTLDELWAWCRSLVKTDIQPRDYGEPLPAHPVADAAAKIPPPDDAMRALAGVLKLGFQLLEPVTQSGGDWSAVRNWPHHFDIATICMLDPDADPEHARSVNVGMSPGDATLDAPYLYVTPWPAPDVSGAPALPGRGRWHTEGFTAAIIEVASHDRETLEMFLAAAVPAAEELLA